MLAFILLASSLVLVSAPPRADSLVVRFIGNEAVSLTDGRLTLVLDFPYEPGAFGYMTYPDEALRMAGEVVVVITHRHRDHFAEERFLRTTWRIVGPREVTASLPQARVVPLDSVVRIADATLRPLATPHAKVEHYSWLVEWKGRRFFFVGDTEDPAALLGAGPLDVAFVSPWLLASARRGGRAVPATQVVLYHHMDPARERCEPCVIPLQGASIRLQ
jgi:L-ascorbate metabolism protein UlaG (beta-lactamase superfamily)